MSRAHHKSNAKFIDRTATVWARAHPFKGLCQGACGKPVKNPVEDIRASGNKGEMQTWYLCQECADYLKRDGRPATINGTKLSNPPEVAFERGELSADRYREVHTFSFDGEEVEVVK